MVTTLSAITGGVDDSTIDWIIRTPSKSSTNPTPTSIVKRATIGVWNGWGANWIFEYPITRICTTPNSGPECDSTIGCRKWVRWLTSFLRKRRRDPGIRRRRRTRPAISGTSTTIFSRICTRSVSTKRAIYAGISVITAIWLGIPSTPRWSTGTSTLVLNNGVPWSTESTIWPTAGVIWRAVYWIIGTNLVIVTATTSVYPSSPRRARTTTLKFPIFWTMSYVG